MHQPYYYWLKGDFLIHTRSSSCTCSLNMKSETVTCRWQISWVTVESQMQHTQSLVAVVLFILKKKRGGGSSSSLSSFYIHYKGENEKIRSLWLEMREEDWGVKAKPDEIKSSQRKRIKNTQGNQDALEEYSISKKLWVKGSDKSCGTESHISSRGTQFIIFALIGSRKAACKGALMERFCLRTPWISMARPRRATWYSSNKHSVSNNQVMEGHMNIGETCAEPFAQSPCLK